MLRRAAGPAVVAGGLWTLFADARVATGITAAGERSETVIAQVGDRLVNAAAAVSATVDAVAGIALAAADAARRLAEALTLFA